MPCKMRPFLLLLLCPFRFIYSGMLWLSFSIIMSRLIEWYQVCSINRSTDVRTPIKTQSRSYNENESVEWTFHQWLELSLSVVDEMIMYQQTLWWTKTLDAKLCAARCDHGNCWYYEVFEIRLESLMLVPGMNITYIFSLSVSIEHWTYNRKMFSLSFSVDLPLQFYRK